MKKILPFLILLFSVGNVLAMSIELGIDEVLIVDNTVVSFDVAQNDPSLVFLFLEGKNKSMFKGLHFGESVVFNGVNYTVGSFDSSKAILKIHLSGNYSSTRILKKRDFEVEVMEAFDAYVKVRIKNTGYYEINDTLVVLAQGMEIYSSPIALKSEESLVVKISPSYTQLTFVLKEAKISKSIAITSLKDLVTIERIWRDEKLHVLLKNHGDPVNVTIKLLVNGLTIEKREISLDSRKEKEVAFEVTPSQGAILVEYGGAIKQETFYFEMPRITLVKVEKEVDKLKIWLRNDGKTTFSGRVSVYQSSIIVGEPYFVNVTIKPGEEAYVEFKVPEEAQILTIGVTSDSYSVTFPISLKGGEISAKAINSYGKGVLGGSVSYVITLTGNGKVRFGVEGLPESIKAHFYYGETQVKELEVVQNAQVVLVLRLPHLPQGFRIDEPIGFNVTVNEIKIPLELEVGGIGILPVYGDNWLAKVNYTSDYHHVGLPYRVVGKEITSPFLFEPWDGEKIAIIYGRYIRQGEDLRLHLLDFSGNIIASSTQEKGKSDYLIFNESKFMIMIEGDNYFEGILLVSDYLNEPRNITLNIKRRDFGEGLRTVIINATSLRGKKLRFSLSSDREVELRVYYFTLNSEKKNFDPLSTNFKGIFRGRGKIITGEVGVRSYEDFIAMAIIGEGNVTISFEEVERVAEVSEVTSKAYFILGTLLALLLMVVYLEKKIG
ncbi:hypothetical protein PFDSM3638_01315 [Pyrococcus furiosus DSM 3638]|uniref:Uncharacterized protein n=3 Tax=Pyrococcus furiosus TaxID=2261 RepID=Q8U420_PYRFU|nr:hypothetical protein [Pyrococcus furiosus]AAL80401.1 hypothetical protein PF0277 [Pyrococcus furiosus DSM 3638]AFN03064.1 hypothetical protein PFC_00450 [Pyrococcus furiosus COM1]QEK77994.1 hypothetical protein PFDSM3638_01315 [Pyrococcus furiosus DSM 3638]